MKNSIISDVDDPENVQNNGGSDDSNYNAKRNEEDPENIVPSSDEAVADDSRNGQSGDYDEQSNSDADDDQVELENALHLSNEDESQSFSDDADDGGNKSKLSEVIVDVETNTKLPAMFEHLYEHQIDAVRFLHKNCIKENGGCILAHHMGMGKTLSTLAFLHTIGV